MDAFHQSAANDINTPADLDSQRWVRAVQLDGTDWLSMVPISRRLAGRDR